MASDPTEHTLTAAQVAAAMVLAYAPLLRQTPRLPTYAQPAITWDCTPTCAPAFAAHLRATWQRLDLRDPAQFSEAEALLFRYLRMHGLLKLYRVALPAHARAAPGAWHEQPLRELVFCLGTILGEKLLAVMTPAERAQWLPWHSFDFYPGRTPHDLTLYGDSLTVLPSSTGQPIYTASTPPTVLAQGVRRPLAFTAHAIERMRDRRIPAATTQSHNSLVDLFAFVQRNHYVEPATLYGTHPAVALFDVCAPGFFTQRYVEELVGPGPHPQRYLYRFGYCPLVPEGDVWLAKTLLVPGFIGTPEYGRLRQASLAPGVKERLLQACEALSLTQLIDTNDFGLIRWFHTHGMPQVIPEPPGAYASP